MYVIGLTGGIASGKSVVSARLAEHGAIVIDSDRLARQVVEPGMPALAAIRERFGDGVIAADGTLDRPALGAIVFSDEQARQDLNAITHPAIRAASSAMVAAARERDGDVVVVHDIPLLVETFTPEAGRAFDTIVVVEADDETRVKRMIELRGMSEQEARSRLAAQGTNEQRRAIADVLIDSNGTLEKTLEQADALWESASSPA